MPASSWGSNSLLVIASSARALAASGRRGGYQIAALDLFGDEDLAEVAFAFERVARAPTGGFKSRNLVAAANRVAPAFGKPRGGFVYGSGFEDRPELLAELAKGRRLLGNSPTVIARCKNPVGF
ncbi:MAG: aldehyde oxidase, partial [Alphaproteobacteria bacterium]